MTTMFAVAGNNDIFIGTDGNLAVVTGIDAIAQAVVNASRAQFGEMILAVDQGVPNFQTIWQNAANVPQYEFYLRNVINAVDGVTGVSDLTVSVANDALSYAATVQTIYGEVSLNV